MAPETPVIRPPQQARARERFQRVIDAGRQILAEQGIQGFTLAHVCERAGVSIGSVYSRVDSIDGLFVAIHNDVMAELDSRTHHLQALSTRTDLTTADLVATAVRLVWAMYREYEGELRAFILRAAADECIRDLGVAHARRLEQAFTSVLASRADEFADADEAIRASFQLLFDTLSWDAAFGGAFAPHADRNAVLRDRLVRMCRLLLLGTPHS